MLKGVQMVSLHKAVIKEMLHSYYINDTTTKYNYRRYCQTKDALNLKLKQLFNLGYFRKEH